MIVTCVHVKVIPEGVQDFIEATTENHRASVEEQGNLRFDLLQKDDDPCQFMIYEAYATEEDSALHKGTSHYLRWRDRVQGLMAEARQGVKYKVIEPSDRSKW